MSSSSSPNGSSNGNGNGNGNNFPKKSSNNEEFKVGVNAVLTTRILQEIDQLVTVIRDQGNAALAGIRPYTPTQVQVQPVVVAPAAAETPADIINAATALITEYSNEVTEIDRQIAELRRRHDELRRGVTVGIARVQQAPVRIGFETWLESIPVPATIRPPQPQQAQGPVGDHAQPVPQAQGVAPVVVQNQQPVPEALQAPPPAVNPAHVQVDVPPIQATPAAEGVQGQAHVPADQPQPPAQDNIVPAAPASPNP
jgi:hypothetical protein